MRVLGGLSILALVLLVGGTAPAARSSECPEYLRIDEAPQWSPDGSEILFLRRHVSDCPSEDGISLEVVGGDGGDPRTLHSGPDLVLSAAWSPEGTRIVVVLLTPDPGEDLLVLEAANGKETLRLHLPFCCTARPAWSPDGARIALDTSILDVATGRLRASEIPTTGSVSWSPDSRRIAYLGPVGLEVAAADGSTRQWIGPGGISAGTVEWSPDGAWIAYQITRELRFVRPDGSGFTEFPDEGFLLGWAPDSRGVLTYVPEDNRLLTIARTDGTAAVVGSAPSTPVSFSWSRRTSAFIDVDLCPRPGLFVRAADAAYRRLTNDCVIRGTPGPDRLVGTSLPDALVGLGGNDQLYGLGGGDVLYGGPGKDEISGGLGDDSATGGAGNDTVSAETATGGSGRDTLIVGSNPAWPAREVHARDGRRDIVRCPLGQWPGPFIFADRIDRISSRCYGT
jgi:dipeptidyl aminopeptidase/acylaminoacyl peptidase